MSEMLVILRPQAFRARTADSRPGPGPPTRTSTFFTPCSCAALPAFSAANSAANGVDLREPRKPQPPAVAQESVFPWRSVIVMMVLLKEACTWAMPSRTFLRAFFGFFAPPAAAAPAVPAAAASDFFSSAMCFYLTFKPCPGEHSTSRPACADPCAYAHSCACAGHGPEGPCDDECRGRHRGPSGA